MRTYKGKCDIFFGIEYRMRKGEMEEQFNKEQRKDGYLRLMRQDRIIAQAWVTCDCYVLGVLLAVRRLLEAVLKQARTTRHPWLIACDANMDPEDFEQSL